MAGSSHQRGETSRVTTIAARDKSGRLRCSCTVDYNLTWYSFSQELCIKKQLLEVEVQNRIRLELQVSGLLKRQETSQKAEDSASMLQVIKSKSFAVFCEIIDVLEASQVVTKDLQEQFELLPSERQENQKIVNDFRDQLDQALVDNTRLSSALQNAHVTEKQLQKDFFSLKAAESHMHDELEVARSSMEELSKKVSVLHQEKAKCEDQCNASKIVEEALRSDLDFAKSVVRDSKRKLEISEANEARAREELNQLQQSALQTVSTKEEQLLKVQASISAQRALEYEVKRLFSALESKEAELYASLEVQKDHQLAVNVANQALKAASTENKALKTAAEALQAELDSKVANARRMASELFAANQIALELKDKESELSLRKASSQTEMAQIVWALQGMLGNVRTAQGLLSAAQHDTRSSETDNHNQVLALKREIEKLRKKLDEKASDGKDAGMDAEFALANIAQRQVSPLSKFGLRCMTCLILTKRSTFACKVRHCGAWQLAIASTSLMALRTDLDAKESELQEIKMEMMKFKRESQDDASGLQELDLEQVYVIAFVHFQGYFCFQFCQGTLS